MAHEDERRPAESGWLPTVARRALEMERLVVKEGGMLWIGDASGDIRPPAISTDPAALDVPRDDQAISLVQGDCGLYHAGGCILSCCVLAIEGHALPGPMAAESQGYEATLAFPELAGRRGDLSVLRTFLVDGAAASQWITVETQAPHPVPVAVVLTLGADFRGATSMGATRGLRSVLIGRKLHLGGVDAAGHEHGTTVAFSRLPSAVRWLEEDEQPGAVPSVELTFRLHPALAEPASLAFTVAPSQRAVLAESTETASTAVYGFDFDTASAQLRHRHARWHLAGALYHGSSPVLGSVLRRGAADLRLLLQPTGVGNGMAPVAALPTPGTVRGRDAILAAFQALMLQPQVAVDTLRLLALHQIAEQDDHSGQRVGMIPHELLGDTITGVGNDRPDAVAAEALEVTPLWVALLAETVNWTGDLVLLEELLPAARRALTWIEAAEERFPHGYLACTSADRDKAPSVLAPVGAQACVHMARRALARLLRRRGAGMWWEEAAALERAADDLRRRVERDFWLQDEGCYAATVDAEGHATPAVTSSSALVLWTRLPSEGRVARLADRLLRSDLLGNWGLRTRSAEDPVFDPFDPCRGSVSTLDTALAAGGLWRAGHAVAAARLAGRVITAAAAHVDEQLPRFLPGSGTADDELRGSSGGRAIGGPAASVAVSPFGMLTALLGAEPDALGHRLMLRPALPPWLGTLSIQHLRVGSAYVDLEVQRVAETGSCSVHAQVTAGELKVMVRPPARIRV